MKDKKRAMGRGLGAILSAESKAVQSATDAGAKDLVGNIVEIPIEDIYPNANQPRTHFDEKALQELAESIKVLGIIQPITVRKDGAKFEIISGERRYRASKMAGLKEIPAYVRLVNDQELLEMALVENIQREDLDAIEDQQALFKQIVNNRLSVRQAEEAAKHFKSPKEISISKEPKTLPNNLRRAEKTLADALALKVEIKSSAKGDKGKIVLNFDNEEELEKILSYFN